MKQKNEDLLTLGIDLGGTKVKTALVDNKGKILSAHKYPTNPEKGVDGVIEDILKCIDGCLGDNIRKAEALGIGIAAQVDLKGNVIYAPNLRWHNIPLKKILEEKLGLPTFVLNDVNAATWGEWRYGSGKNVSDLVVIFVGTGVGGGVISGSKMVIGCNNSGGELGHITIVLGGRQCHCPNNGCLEAYAGGWAIAERAQEAVRANPQNGKQLISLAGTIENITAKTVGDAYYEKDPLSVQLIEETIQCLAAGVVSIVNAFNPCILILGGGIIEGIPELISEIEKIAKEKALESSLVDLKITKSALGGDAGIIGAAIFAQNEIKGIQ
ncbi:MAG: ROK family protein [Candidatus Bathyarchaeota archaeon]|nr:ROK family protein [Candidatus Bathyarchaeota archaeon]